MVKASQKVEIDDPNSGPIVSKRFAIALLLIIGGIAWIAYYYIAVRAGAFDIDSNPDPQPGRPKFMADLEDWNYLIGFVLFFLGLMVSSHPMTPLGRGRGVVVGMLGSFVLGLIWICTFYIFSQDLSPIPVFNDLGQKNLFVGIAFMGVGFVFATKWE